MYFRDCVKALEPDFRGPYQVKMLKQVENEIDNLRAAMEWSRESDPHAGAELAFRLKWFWHMYNLFEEGAHWLKGLLAANHKAGLNMDTLVRAGALSVLSWLAFWAGDGLETTRACLQESDALVEKEHGPFAARIRADNLYISGILALAGQDLSRAELLGQQCLEAYRACGSRFGMAEACIVLFGSAFDSGDLEAARHWNEMGIALRIEVGDKDGLAFNLTMGSLIPFSLGDYQGAKRILADAVDASKDMFYKYNHGLALGFQGMNCLFEGDLRQSLDDFSQQAALADEASDPVLKGLTIYFLALLLLKLGQYRLALQLRGALEASNRYEAVMIYENPVTHNTLQQYRREAGDALGETEYNATIAEGRLLSLDQAVTHGLQEAESAMSRLPGKAAL